IPELSSAVGALLRHSRMRTSKKGGRDSSWAGRESGAEAAAAPAPAPVLSPAVTRYQSSSPRRSVKGQLLRGLGWFALVVLVIGAGVGGGLYLYYNESLDVINGNSNPATSKTKSIIDKLGSPSDPAIALIAGYDVRAGTGSSSYAGSNSDTLML